jgi:hypothetical protein
VASSSEKTILDAPHVKGRCGSSPLCRESPLLRRSRELRLAATLFVARVPQPRKGAI